MDALPREVTSVSKGEIEPFKQGRRVGCYLLGKTLGEGSFAKVKEGLHIITGEKVAVKIIDKKRAREDRYISKNLRREARIHQLVRHPNIIQLYEVLETDNFYYLVMEYCAGGELLDYICTRKRLEETVAKRIVAQLVSAVDGMHKSGVVHRDLKIENFLLNDNEDLKIIDFGLSNTLSLDAMQEHERTGVFPQLLNTHCGSPAYAAPELLAQKKYGPQVDVWSIGINMYAMLTGFLPYMMEPFNVMEMYEKMMQRRMTPIPGFLSKPCRDLLMRLLEPVAEWRITLKQVMKHKWFSDSVHVPRSIPLGDMMYQKKELCESVLSYMKYNLKIRTKDTINAVVSNRAVYASAVYHLLVARLDRCLKEKNENWETNKQFAKVEVIKKSNLSTDNFHEASAPTNRSKRFTFRGKKIDGTSRSQQDFANDNDELDANEDAPLATDEPQNNKKEYKKLKDENASNSATNVSTTMSSTPSSPDSLDIQSQNHSQRNPTHKGHRRAHSSVNPNELRQAEEIVRTTIRNSLISDSKEDLLAGSIPAQSTPEQPLRSNSPEDLFGKSGKGTVKVSRKISFDVGMSDLGSPNSGEKEIDVAKFLPESTRKVSDERKKMKRKVSVDYQINESNVKEKKEPIPGWLITKIIKQPPLKEEPKNTPEQRSLSVSPTNPDANVSSASLDPSVLPTSPNGFSSDRSSPDTKQTHESDSEKSKRTKKTIKRPGTPEKWRDSRQPSDMNNNIMNEEKNNKNMSVSDQLNSFMTNNIRNTTPEDKTKDLRCPKHSTDDSDEISDAVVNELINNVRNITQNYVSDSNNDNDNENKTRTRKHSENRNSISETDSVLSVTPSPPPPSNTSDDSLLTHPPSSRTINSSTNTSEGLDENNNNNNNNNDNTGHSDDNTDGKKPPKINTKAFRNNSIRGRILALENYEQKLRNRRTEKAAAASVSPIKKITISKKTLELNVKQFQQFKGDQKNETDVHHSNNKNPNKLFPSDSGSTSDNNKAMLTSPKSPLKPLELKFDFQRRKKKVYKEKQQTRSLTDVTNGIMGKVDSKPTEEQMLTRKHRCNDNCTAVEGCCHDDIEEQVVDKEPTDVRSFYDSSGTINMADNSSDSRKKPTIKIISHSTANNKNSIRNKNRTKIFLSAARKTTMSQQSAVPTMNQDDVTVMSSVRNSSTAHHEEPLLVDSNNSSFDSGFFGTNSSPPVNEVLHSVATPKDSGGENSSSVNSTAEKNKRQPMEVHSVKYRCIPVYQLEYTKTGTIHNKEGALEVISEENKQKHYEQNEAGATIHRKWGSQTIEPTQDPVEYIPRSAEIINITKEKFQKEREKKMELLKTESRRIDTMTRSRSVENSPSLGYKRVRVQKQFPIETNVVGTTPSPRFIRRVATYGVVNNRSRTVPSSPCTSPTVYGRAAEKEKILAFTHALGTAAWRKRSVLSATN